MVVTKVPRHQHVSGRWRGVLFNEVTAWYSQIVSVVDERKLVWGYFYVHTVYID